MGEVLLRLMRWELSIGCLSKSKQITQRVFGVGCSSDFGPLLIKREVG